MSASTRVGMGAAVAGYGTFMAQERMGAPDRPTSPVFIAVGVAVAIVLAVVVLPAW